MNDQIVLRQEIKQVIIRGGPVVANIVPFTAVATIPNQTVFQLLNAQGNPVLLSQIICLFIVGSGQNPLTADYTVSVANGGTVVTLSQTVPIPQGYSVYGAGTV